MVKAKREEGGKRGGKEGLEGGEESEEENGGKKNKTLGWDSRGATTTGRFRRQHERTGRGLFPALLWLWRQVETARGSRLSRKRGSGEEAGEQQEGWGTDGDAQSARRITVETRTLLSSH